ncbi:MAG TPA: TRAP transporter large permease subunit [Xanthobacteraceae bacterium]|nr:TRAP transporter large permease subunit [Xanthobacteraceae bacterium]
MESHHLGLLGFVVLLVFIGLRLPIAFALALVGLGGMFLLTGPLATSAMLSTQLYSAVANNTLTAVPLFLLMGYFAFHAGLTRAAFSSARIWFARLPGGLAMATVAGCALFGACSGSGVAAAGAMGRVAIPEMLRYGYDKKLATGAVAAAATLAVLVPPSIVMVVYAIIVEASIGRLLMAGYLPALLSAAVLMAMIYVRVKRKPELAPAVPFEVTWSDRIAALKEVWGITVLIVLVLGGIYLGFVTATEAAAVGALGALVLMATAGELNWTNFRDAVLETARTTAMIFLLLIGAAMFTGFMALSGVPQLLAEYIVESKLSFAVVMLIICIVFVFLGCFLDSISMMLLTIPVLLPVLASLDVNLIWFGVIVVKLVEIGCITPPFGITVYVVKGVVGNTVALEDVFRGIWWFLLMEILTLLILIFFPQISLFLPEMMLGRG